MMLRSIYSSLYVLIGICFIRKILYRILPDRDKCNYTVMAIVPCARNLGGNVNVSNTVVVCGAAEGVPISQTNGGIRGDGANKIFYILVADAGSVIKFARKHGCRRAMYVDDILEPGVIKGNADVVSAVTDIITGARAILSDFDMNYPEFVSAGRLMVTHINERLNARW